MIERFLGQLPVKEEKYRLLILHFFHYPYLEHDGFSDITLFFASVRQFKMLNYLSGINISFFFADNNTEKMWQLKLPLNLS